MLISCDREKLINAIVYFVATTKHCHTLKLFKLLNLLDFEHFRQAGRTVTGLSYRALPMGPVPTALLQEFQRGGDADLKQSVGLIEIKDEFTDELMRRDIKPKVKFNPKLFTKRELAIMNRLSEFFVDLRGEDMSELSHWKRLPWFKVYGRGEGQGRAIPPELALDSERIVHDAPTMDKAEIQYRKELLEGLS